MLRTDRNRGHQVSAKHSSFGQALENLLQGHGLSDAIAGDVTPLFQIDDGRLFNQLPVRAPDAAIRKNILVDNPARLYGFG
jgi:hypothetical protein